MRSQHYIRQLKQGAVTRRFGLEDIERRAGQAAGFQSFVQGRFVDQLAARAV
jgi:hypothetical protein